jgi:hypothetical protein
MGLGIDPQVLEAANHALGLYIGMAGDEFYNSSANCKALQAQLKKMGIPIENWGGPGAENVWAAAAFQCRKNGTLEPAPSPKSKAELEREYEANDRRPGSRAGNQIQEGDTEADNTRKIVESAKGLRNRLEEETNKKITDAATKRDMQDNPHKYLPDFKIDQPAEVLKSLESPVLRLWMRKRADFLSEEAPKADQRRQ